MPRNKKTYIFLLNSLETNSFKDHGKATFCVIAHRAMKELTGCNKNIAPISYHAVVQLKPHGLNLLVSSMCNKNNAVKYQVPCFYCIYPRNKKRGSVFVTEPRYNISTTRDFTIRSSFRMPDFTIASRTNLAMLSMSPLCLRRPGCGRKEISVRSW